MDELLDAMLSQSAEYPSSLAELPLLLLHLLLEVRLAFLLQSPWLEPSFPLVVRRAFEYESIFGCAILLMVCAWFDFVGQKGSGRVLVETDGTGFHTTWPRSDMRHLATDKYKSS